MKDFKIIKTGDGSNTLMSERLEETYHSINGAMTESLHVFIQNGLYLHKADHNDIHILEVGLGTGLNALLTLENIPFAKTIYYTAIEPFPLPVEVALEYYTDFETKPKRTDTLAKIISPGKIGFTALDTNFSFCCLSKILQDISKEEIIAIYAKDDLIFSNYDIIYYDAFGPVKQPEMWLPETLKVAVDLLKPGGILTTYCAQGQFKRNLRALDMHVEAVKGPAGKREMTIARKLTSSL